MVREMSSALPISAFFALCSTTGPVLGWRSEIERGPGPLNKHEFRRL